jgi:short-subunit dehydrogenase
MGSTALITGASSGLGAEFARLFARDKCDVVLVARRKDRLEALAAGLSGASGVKSHVIAVDLMAPDGAARVAAEVKRLGLEIDYLVNNAGFGTSGTFWELDADKERGELQVNVMTVVELTRALLPGMVQRKRGRILNIGSTAGFQPGPFMATYYASKAFVNSWTEALSFELKGTGVTATVSCPGATATEFGAVAGNDKSLLFKVGMMSSGEVAAQAYHAMQVGRPMVVHGLKNKLAAFSIRFSPRGVIRALTASLNKTGPSQPALKA